jgi:hypothetical protein
LMIDCLFGCRNSIGSSMVMMCDEVFSFR